MNTEDHGAMTIDYEQSLFPSLVRRASEMKSARRGDERRAREERLSLPVFARCRLFSRRYFFARATDYAEKGDCS